MRGFVTSRTQVVAVITLLVVFGALAINRVGASNPDPFVDDGAVSAQPLATTISPSADGSAQLEAPTIATPPEPEQPTGSVPAATGVGAEDEKVLRLVYFVEADAEFDPYAVDMIESQAVALQQFWYDQFGGTFRLGTDIVDVVHGDHPAEWYHTMVNGDDERWFRLNNLHDETQIKLGVSTDADNVRLLTFPATRIDGVVGATRYQGAWLDGDDITCIDGSIDTTPYSADFPANCLTTAAHELGHVYGLGHQGDEADCMQFGFYQYVSDDDLCDFSAENRAIVIDDPGNAGWLDAKPGDRG